MFMEPNNSGTNTRKRRAGDKSSSIPQDLAVLDMAVNFHSPFGRSTVKSLARSEDNVRHVFQTACSKANREIARLLRDVRTESNGALLNNTANQPRGELLLRAVQCAAKQYMLQAELGNLALSDELTRLYNRRGFMALADRQLKLSRRAGRGLLLFYMDVDGLKAINDSFGHSEGDAVLKRAAEVLKKTFRDSDVIARIGGDEFAVLAIEASRQSESAIRARLSRYIKSTGAAGSRYSLTLSLGVGRFDPRRPTSIADLMMQADQAMYEQKRGRAKLRGVAQDSA
jgi:diguanylate cyclase (GGDEF)-like protein